MAKGTLTISVSLIDIKYKAALAITKIYEESGYLPQQVKDQAEKKAVNIMEHYGYSKHAVPTVE